MTGKQNPDVRLRQLSTSERLTTRRNVLKTSAAALTGAGLFTSSVSAQDGDGLSAHTGSVKVVDRNTVKAEGQVTGMDKSGHNTVQVGCEHRYEDGHGWDQSFHGTVSAAHSATFILTIVGLKPDKKCKCRVVCCPVEQPEKVCKGETVEFTIGKKIQSADEKKTEKEEPKTTTKKHHDGHGGSCPCDQSHQDRKHVTFNCPRGGWSSYNIQVTGKLSPCGSSCKPSQVPHRNVEDVGDFTASSAGDSIWNDEAHSYLFTGDIHEVETGADVETFVNGRQVT